MLTRLSALVLALIGATSLLGCSSSDSMSSSSTGPSSTSSPTVPPADVVVAASGSATSTSLKVGQTLDIEVSAPSGTNYSWSVARGYDAAVVRPADGPEPRATKPGMPGAPAVTTFRFTAVGAGATEIVLENRDNSSGELGQRAAVNVTVTA